VGAGLAGLTAADRLGRAGLEVVVVQSSDGSVAASGPTGSTAPCSTAASRSSTIQGALVSGERTAVAALDDLGVESAELMHFAGLAGRRPSRPTARQRKRLTAAKVAIFVIVAGAIM
jgi:2-polyprenyl-6-methoxyphenol hydroxylase-like FAD-dependent oxidoreductase